MKRKVRAAVNDEETIKVPKLNKQTDTSKRLIVILEGAQLEVFKVKNIHMKRFKILIILFF